MKSLKLKGIGLLLGLTLLAGCSNGEHSSLKDYKTDNPIKIESVETGDINDINFNLYSINEHKKENSVEINLLTYGDYSEEEIAPFIKAYVESIEVKENKDVRVDIYHIDASGLDVVNDETLLEKALLTYVYDDNVIYSQYTDEVNEVTDEEDKQLSSEDIDKQMEQESGNEDFYEPLNK